MRILTGFLALILLTLTPHAAHAQNDESYVKLRILPERGTIKPGEELWIGIEQSIAPHWHTYWKNPGDSGAKPAANWDLPAGFEISGIHWPTPDKIPYAPLLNYGYSDHVILLQKLTAPANLPPGPINLKADLEVLVCKEECIPEFAEINITLNGDQSADEDNTAYIAAARALLPQNVNWPARFEETAQDFILTTTLPADHGLSDATLKTAQFIPADWGILNNPAPVRIAIKGSTLTLAQTKGERAFSNFKTVSGLLRFDTPGFKLGYKITATPDGSAPPEAKAVAQTTPKTAAAITTIAGALILALLGGIILNLMPCVFPVLSIKALSLVKTAAKKPALAKKHGLAYTAGVVLSFLAIAGLLIALQAGGAKIGWGFQLQNSFMIGALAYLLFVIGLNLAGLYDITGAFGNIGGKLTQNQNLTGSFFTGILAALVATPCTAPFMAGAIGIALTQPPVISLLIFAMLGFGLALPYLALSFAPGLQSRLPKPGAWMEIFRQALAFPMFASSAWLVWVLSQQVGPMGVLTILMGMVALAFGLWVIRHTPKSRYWKIKIRILALLSLLIALLCIPAAPQIDTPMPPAQNNSGETFGEAYTPAKLDALLQTDRPVFIEMTAAWCITCKVNHKIAINTQSTRDLFAAQNIAYLIGDWTNRDETITKFLQNYGRAGVPLYVFYARPDPQTGKRPEAVILPQILTPGIVKDALTKP